MGSMNTPDEQRGMFSRLPEDQEYWRELTEKIVEDAAPQLSTFGKNQPEWWSEIARFSTLLAAGAAAAILAFFTLMPSGGAAATAVPSVDAYGLAPSDPLAVTLVLEETPPTMGTLMAVRNTENER